ncbi:MAG: hypothetical protein PHQ93_08980 [Sulfurimonas sp.]|uniref:hypothetical protein n=1 Tax=Sulfurimonas sp. TaxID=2022749 RepID=UPI00261774A1|nr:hypothetical protein [Sulfurimonas sp.]MDD5401304.1 hypothetical protein [Sulfurimonas sp.]
MRLKNNFKMMKMMMTITKKTIKLIVVAEIFILLTYLISFKFFINLQIAFLSSFIIILGSMYAYQRMVKSEINTQNIDEKRDFYDELEDPHELYDETPINETPAEELDLKTIVNEEKKKIKIFNFGDVKKSAKAGVSLFRLIPYLFLILGFIALKNNELLDIPIYFPSLLIGIIIGYIISKDLVEDSD